MKTEVRSIVEIREAYMAGEFNTKLPFFLNKDKLKETHVFDENESVKWNRTKVEDHNATIDIKVKEYKADAYRLSEALREETIQALQNEYNFNREQAEKVQGYTYQEYHSSMFDYFQYLEELAELVQSVAELGEAK